MRKFLLLTTLFITCSGLAALGNTTDTLYFATTGCDSVVFFDQIYYSDTTAEHWLVHENGDSTLYVLSLHLNYSDTTDIYDTACPPYYWGETAYYESGVYPMKYINSNGCDSVVRLHLTLYAAPELTEIVGDTLVCRHQLIRLAYSEMDTAVCRYNWSLDGILLPAANVPVLQYQPVGNDADMFLFTLSAEHLETGCRQDTSLLVRVCSYEAPHVTEIRRKGESNIFMCSPVPEEFQPFEYRWGSTEKSTLREDIQEWDYNYCQFNVVDTTEYDYWVETYKYFDGVQCKNRTLYGEGVITAVPEYERVQLYAFAKGGQLQVSVENPNQLPAVCAIFNIDGKMLAQYDLGSDPIIRRQFPFPYACGLYFLTVQAASQRFTTKIVSQ